MLSLQNPCVMATFTANKQSTILFMQQDSNNQPAIVSSPYEMSASKIWHTAPMQPILAREKPILWRARVRNCHDQCFQPELRLVRWTNYPNNQRGFSTSRFIGDVDNLVSLQFTSHVVYYYVWVWTRPMPHASQIINQHLNQDLQRLWPTLLARHCFHDRHAQCNNLRP